jgi:hypothetical protein
MKPYKQGKHSFYGEKYSKTIPRIEMIDINLSILEIKKLIFSKVKHAFKDDHPIHQ